MHILQDQLMTAFRRYDAAGRPLDPAEAHRATLLALSEARRTSRHVWTPGRLLQALPAWHARRVLPARIPAE